ncbi:MAG: RsmE family RNA methyltransferase [Actinomycetota bacterium]|nr:RsmE family RNA methyltransferase [Actinomycetota bacterium]
MSPHRFFLGAALPEGDGPVEIPLADADRHHLADVARVRVGERIAVVDPDGTAWEVEVSRVDRAGVEGLRLLRLDEDPAWRVTLVQGLAKGAKIDLVVEKTTEIGVEAVVPVLTARSVVRLDGEKTHDRGERWRRVARAAAQQSQRSTIPRIHDPQPLAVFVEQIPAYDVVLVTAEDAADAPGVGEALASAGAHARSRIAVVVGPEGGMTPDEVRTLVDAGALPVFLGRNILRSETAGILAVALCVYEIGGLGGRSRG